MKSVSAPCASPRATWSSRHAVMVVGLALGTVALAAARQDSSAQQPTFRAGVEVIQLDVSVLDKDRKPIRDLTKADFTVLEDGKPQHVVAFSAVDVPDPPPVAAGRTDVDNAKTWKRDVTPDVTSNALPPEGRLFAMVLDDALLPFEPTILAAAKRAATSVVNHLGAGDEMAIVFTADGRDSQDFTNDRTKLLAAVDKLQAGHATYNLGWDMALGPQTAKLLKVPAQPPAMDGDDQLRQGSLNTLRDVAEVLVSAPQRRKVLAYISPGIPINYEDTSPALAHGSTGTIGEMHGKTMAVLEENRRLAEQLADVFRMMQRGNVTVYPIDPSGLGGLETYVERILNGQRALIEEATEEDKPTAAPEKHPDPTATRNNPRDLAHHLVLNDLDFLETAADNTGGRAIVNTNDFGPGIDAIFRENGSYYLLGIEEADAGSGNMHRLNVKVDRPDVDVRTRHGFYSSDAKMSAKEAAASPVTRAIAAALPNGTLPMQVTLAPFASSSADAAAVAIVLDVDQPAPKERTPGTIDLETKAFTPDGDARGDHAQTVHLTLLPGANADAFVRYQLLSQIDLKPGRYQLRIGAHNTIGDRTDSVFADVEVPDFANAPVARSGNLIEATPTPSAAPKDALASLVPIVPTAERVFAGRDHASAFLRVYQGGSSAIAPLTLHVTILNDKGETALDRSDEIGAASFDAKTRAADERIALPLDKLAPGDYLLTVETSLGKTTARRDVRFTVR